MPRHYNKFTQEEVDQIIASRTDGLTIQEIADCLGCDFDHIKNKLAALRITNSIKRSPRKCLSCGTQFPSAGPQNRICPQCSTATHRDAGRFADEFRVAR